MPQLIVHPPAFQTVTPGGSIRRKATCIEHDRTSVLYRGVQSDGWIFKCHGPPEHWFTATPDPTAPTTVEAARHSSTDA